MSDQSPESRISLHGLIHRNKSLWIIGICSPPCYVSLPGPSFCKMDRTCFHWPLRMKLLTMDNLQMCFMLSTSHPIHFSSIFFVKKTNMSSPCTTVRYARNHGNVSNDIPMFSMMLATVKMPRCLMCTFCIVHQKEQTMNSILFVSIAFATNFTQSNCLAYWHRYCYFINTAISNVFIYLILYWGW